MSSYSGTVKDADGKEFSVSISLSEVANPQVETVETPAVDVPVVSEVAPGEAEAQEMPAEGAES